MKITSPEEKMRIKNSLERNNKQQSTAEKEILKAINGDIDRDF